MQFILKTHDIAILLDMSPDDVNALARKGFIKGSKIGKQWRFRSKEVNKYLDKQRSLMMPQGMGLESPEYGKVGKGEKKA